MKGEGVRVKLAIGRGRGLACREKTIRGGGHVDIQA